MDLKQFRYFLAVADEGSVTHAARLLGMTQPALSRAIRALETAVGVALFVRTPQGLRLTDAGKFMRHDARRLVDSADAVLTRVARFAHEGRHLRVTARGCDVDMLERLVSSYNASSSERTTARPALVEERLQAEQIRRGEADVTLIRDPFEGQGLDSEVVASEPRVAVLPDSHALAGRTEIHRSELAGEAFPIWPGLTESGTAFWTGTDLVPYDWHPGPRVHDAGQFLGSIQLGLCVGFLAASHLPRHLPKGLVVRPVTSLSPSSVHVAWAVAEVSPDVARFVRHATARHEKS
ncbi:LysR family transcriptional regulator [Streptomyces parvulus]|uniref:LysR family transcriptional regulator n=1 Tax=Streptomyces parvulus TaxID=146923 RepID=UPI00342EC4F7